MTSHDPIDTEQAIYEKELLEEQIHMEHIQDQIETALAITQGRIKPSEDFTDLAINTVFRMETEHLQIAKNHPYFAKIDFQEIGQKFKENAYIGRFGLFDRQTYTPVIIDWRAPIANLYYEDKFTEITVDTGSKQPLLFDVYKKRQFEIKNGQIQAYFDSTGTINSNHLLIERLQEKSEVRLKDIVETIQADQNRVIRADSHRAMIVQGVAGSGKTTIALHRLSFLAYQKKNQKTTQPFVVIAPNRFMIDYISEVLPHLGMDGVVQTTWEDLLLSTLPIRVKLTDSHKKNQRFFENSHLLRTKEYQIEIIASQIRTSLAMKSLLDRYINHFLLSYIPERDLTLDSVNTMSFETIYKQFHEDYKHYPLMKRRDKVIQSMQRFAKDSLAKWEMTWEKQKKKLTVLEQLKKKDDMQKQYEKILSMYTSRMKSVDIKQMYKKLITNPKSVQWLIKQSNIEHAELAEEVTQYLTQVHESANVEWEDLAALFYLAVRFYGVKTPKYSHMIVDEAQDLAPLQFATLKEFVHQDAISVFGDLSQSIYSYRGVRDWSDLEEGIFSMHPQKFSLQKSYRSTIEIMNLANLVLTHLSIPEEALAVPVLRHGKEPVINKLHAENEGYEFIHNLIEDLQKEGLQNIAIIEKNIAYCERAANQLKESKINVHLITEKETHYQGGILVIPVYLAKGMEFDAVIVLNPTPAKYNSSVTTDVKLLYVAMTRALHHLSIVGWDALTPLLYEAQSIPK